MKFATLNDTHFGVKGDVPYMLDYQEKFYREFFFPTLKEQGVKKIKHGGDIFDRRKYINFITLNRTKTMFLDPALDAGIEIDIIPGNHDVSLKNSNEINSLRELLYGYKNVNIIETPTVEKLEDDVSIMMLPWLNGENYHTFMKFVEENDADILYAHLELQGFEMHGGIKNDHGLDPKLFSKFKETWSGHFHHQSKAANIHYLGAPMEFVWSDHGDKRGFHIYDTKTKELTFHQNPYTLYEKIFYDDTTEEEQEKFRTFDTSKYKDKIVKVFVTRKTKPAIFEYFIDNLYKENLIDLTIMEDYSAFHGSDAEFEIKENSTKDLMEKYIEGSETEMDKNRLKSILNSLYVEALHAGTK